MYASHADEAAVNALFAEFSVETGIPVVTRFGRASEQAGALIAKTDEPRADVLFATAVHELWRAADEGALRPLGGIAAKAGVPAALRDPDDAWTAISYVEARILVDGRVLDAAAVDSFEYLAEPALAGRLCLTGPDQPVNRAVIAHWLDGHGRRPAERLVRGWLANLAKPPFAAERELVAAIAAGTCGAGIVSSAAGRPVIPGFARQPLAAVTPVPAIVNVEAAGISRHAGNPDAARRLIAWLLSEPVQARYPAAGGRLPASGSTVDAAVREVAVVGRENDEVLKLAERARYR